jgi:hypothetical protein
MVALCLIQCCAAPGLSLVASSPAINASVQLSFISTFRFSADVATDRWIMDDEYIYLAEAPELVIGVAGLEIVDGASLLLGQKLPGRQVFQQWDWLSMSPYIKNIRFSEYVIDCVDKQPGTGIEIRSLTRVQTQQWMLTPLAV